MTDTDDCTAERLSWVFDFLHWADLADIARVYGVEDRAPQHRPTQGYLRAKLDLAGTAPRAFWHSLTPEPRKRLCRLAREKYGPSLPLPLELSLWGLHQVAEVLSLTRPLYTTLIDFMADWDPYPAMVDLWGALDEPQRRELLTAWETERGD